MKRPKSWRKGQMVFNFLEWLHQTGKVGPNQNVRMADPFYIDDKDWDKWYEEYLESCRSFFTKMGVE